MRSPFGAPSPPHPTPARLDWTTLPGRAPPATHPHSPVVHFALPPPLPPLLSGAACRPPSPLPRHFNPPPTTTNLWIQPLPFGPVRYLLPSPGGPCTHTPGGGRHAHAPGGPSSFLLRGAPTPSETTTLPSPAPPPLPTFCPPLPSLLRRPSRTWSFHPCTHTTNNRHLHFTFNYATAHTKTLRASTHIPSFSLPSSPPPPTDTE